MNSDRERLKFIMHVHAVFVSMQKVVEVSKKYLPYMSSGFASKKLQLNFADGFDFMGKHQGEFDVIITDSSDPIGNVNDAATIAFGDHCRKIL